MAGQDFARVEAQVLQPEDVRPMGQMKVMLLILAALTVLGVSFAGGFMMGREHGAQEVNNQDEARLFEQLKQQKEELAALRAMAATKKIETVSTTQVGELTFYNQLPNQSVEPAPLKKSTQKATLKQLIEREIHEKSDDKHVEPIVEKKHKKKAESIEDQRYQLQIASFQSKKEADAFVLKMKGKGMPASIQKVNLDQLGTWYRVYTGVFSSHDQAIQARVKFKKDLNISSIVVNLD